MLIHVKHLEMCLTSADQSVNCCYYLFVQPKVISVSQLRSEAYISGEAMNSIIIRDILSLQIVF